VKSKAMKNKPIIVNLEGKGKKKAYP